jgi:hypothetical protein
MQHNGVIRYKYAPLGGREEQELTVSSYKIPSGSFEVFN